MSFPEYKQALLNPVKGVQAILDEFYHSGPSACFFKTPPDEEAKLKREVVNNLKENFSKQLSLDLELHPLQLVICGSAHLGFSPTPGKKLGKSFSCESSDIDLAIIHSELFDRWWSEIRMVDTEISQLNQNVVDNIFYGYIDPQHVRKNTEIGKVWWATFGKIKTERAKAIRGRLYRTHWAMQQYHSNAILKAKAQLEGRIF